uniref:Uncharacterized protein n=1 Tax=Avena sativa TaxID=4498 RepID=A0ACD5V755_AVESA
MGCCACEMGACFHPITQYFKDVYSNYLQPIVKNQFVQFFIIYVFPIVEFFIPISVTSFLLLIILRPSNVVPRVEAAVVSRFSLNNATSTLGYDIAVELSFHNRKYLDAKYLDLMAVASYGGTRLGPTVDVLPIFVQRSNATNVVHAVFQGAAVHLDPPAAKVYEKEAADGEFNVLLTVATTFMYDVFIKKVVYYYDHECYIQFPAPNGGGASMLTPGAFCNAIAR